MHCIYPDFNEAIQLCLIEGKLCYVAKSDMKSAFRNMGIKKNDWKYLVMKATSPLDGKTYYLWTNVYHLEHQFHVHIFKDSVMQ